MVKVNLLNYDNKCILYAAGIAINKNKYRKFARISKIKDFLNKHNSKGINYSQRKELLLMCSMLKK